MSRRDATSRLTWPFIPLAFVMTIGALVAPVSRAAGPPEIDGRELVRVYREVVDYYRGHDPAHSAEGSAVVLRAARWDIDLVRLAAKLAAMPPPDVATRVPLEAEEGDEAPQGNAEAVAARQSAAAVARERYPGNDARDTAFRESGSRLAGGDPGGVLSAPKGDRDRDRMLATVRPMPPSPAATEAQVVDDAMTTGDKPRAPEAGASGACLIESSAEKCADALKAAALLHSDVATIELARGEHKRAAIHRVIAGWLLWHLPRSARDDAFVRDWLLAVNVHLRGDGSLSSARQLGQLGLRRFPKDDALMLSTASAMEALAILCYEADGKPLGGEDCFETPVAFDASQPQRPIPNSGRPLDRGQVLHEAEELLRTLAARRPTDSEVRLRLGHILSQRGQAQQAQIELRWVIANAKGEDHVALAHLLLGRLAEARQDAQGALEEARAAQAAAPSSQSVRMALAHALLAHGDREDALVLMAALPNEPPKTRDPWAELLLGSLAGFAPARAALYARVRLP